MPSGQTLQDRINAAKFTLAGPAFARSIFKATTEEFSCPKKKHLVYLTSCTYKSKIAKSEFTSFLIARLNHSNLAVVYKALITLHHLMNHGSEEFTSYFASSKHTTQINNLMIHATSEGYGLNIFIRRYSTYINQKALSYRTLGHDLSKRMQNDKFFLDMPIEKLLETLSVIQRQLDSLLDFDYTADDLYHSVILASFKLLFADTIHLYARYNEVIFHILDEYFGLNKKLCRESFEAYKKFLSVTNRVVEFIEELAQEINLNRDEVPNFKKAPSSLLDVLEQHLISLEGNDDIYRPDDDSKSLTTFLTSDSNDPESSQPKNTDQMNNLIDL